MPPKDPYIHGYALEEQQRLLAQAEFWRQDLILPDLPYQNGQSLLEMGCGAGAVLKVLGEAFPGLKLSGIDLEERQIDFAKEHLKGRGVDLRAGNALQLPWPDQSFDHVYMMWFLEHLADPLTALKEAYRVLKPGGTVLAHECDYPPFTLEPASADFSYFWEAYLRAFGKAGQLDAGIKQEGWMREAGFEGATARRMGFEWKAGPDFKRRIEYILAFAEPTLGSLEGDPERLRRGVAAFRAAAELPQASFTGLVYRGTGFKAS